MTQGFLFALILCRLITTGDYGHVQPSEGIVYFSYDDGVNWINTSSGLPEKINLTDLVPENDLIMATTKQSGIFVFDAQQNAWQMTTRPPTKTNVDAGLILSRQIYIGTEGEGVFYSPDLGKTWHPKNSGLGNKTVRRLTAIDGAVFAGTNAGLYVLKPEEHKWLLVVAPDHQVNGITATDKEIFVGTNSGIYSAQRQGGDWREVRPKTAIHNLASDGRIVFALAYDGLFLSEDGGKFWQDAQGGLPAGLYSFQLKRKGNLLFVGQWNGVYKSTDGKAWRLSSAGLPAKFPLLNSSFIMKSLSRQVPAG